MRFILILLLSTQALFGQYFGQNKVQYNEFDWNFIVSPNFNVYYYGDNHDLAIFTSKVAEESLDQIGKHLRWRSQKPIKIIVYTSHNDFQQTNIVNVYMSEGIGGVTELYKNRIVIPFEGSYAQFKHVIHHELVHAIINDMIYGGNVQGVLSGRVLLQVPLWANEGLAEFLSVDWDTKSDMVLRDLAIEENLPQVEQLNYSILAYKGGQSVWQYITKKYGREKVGEVFQQMRRTQNAEKGFESALGVDFEKLTEDWHDYLKKEYWSDINKREKLSDFSEKLTDRSKTKNFYNVSPAFSPDGNTIAYFTDQSGYMDLVLLNVSSGKQKKRLIRGNNSPDFEELKWLQPGLSWSPNGKQIAFASKSGEEDSIIIVNVRNGKYKKIPIGLDGVFTTSWHPSGNKIAFIGQKNNSNDLYLIDLDDNVVTNLSNDIYSDFNPSWSLDGSKIFFSSDRSNYKPDIDMSELDFSNNDIFYYDLNTKSVNQVTNTSYHEDYPVVTKDNILFYTADYNGVHNIFMHNLDTDETKPITNVITGIQQIDVNRSSNKIVFSGYKDRGWDLFLIDNPTTIESKEIPTTVFYATKDEVQEFEDLRFVKDKSNIDEPEDYSKYIFARSYKQYNNADGKNADIDSIPDSLRTTGNYNAQQYKTEFSLDYVYTSASIDNLFGTTGLANIAWSDVMGDHQIRFASNLVLDLDNSDIALSYGYLKNRTNYYGTLFQYANLFSLGYSIDTDYIGLLRDYGVGFFAQYPFSKFNRIDVGTTLRGISYEIKEIDYWTGDVRTNYTENLQSFVPLVSWVYDNTTNTYTGPNDGLRQYLTFQFSPDIGDDSLAFKTIKFDIRKYFKINRNYSIATRMMLGRSFGRDPEKFFLGGSSQMTFYSDTQTEGRDDSGLYAQRILDYDNSTILEDVFFTEYVFPVRGARYRERTGENVAVANLEFRFPFINYVDVSFPARIRFGNIFGHLFLDVGAAWDDSEEFDDSSLVRQKYNLNSEDASPIISTFGVGMKIFTPWALVRLDTAWDRYPNGDYSKPQYILSIGYDW
jgi:Tol biopolymer transport system component